MLSHRSFDHLSAFLSTIVTPDPELLALVFVQLLAQLVLLGFPGATSDRQSLERDIQGP